jgi:hypothetical protein
MIFREFLIDQPTAGKTQPHPKRKEPHFDKALRPPGPLPAESHVKPDTISNTSSVPHLGHRITVISLGESSSFLINFLLHFLHVNS